MKGVTLLLMMVFTIASVLVHGKYSINKICMNA